ncbi:MAG: hypothetical protein AVDCRST_MAG56-2247 [uncultured Cytophagales bacterium]|uniref:Transglutaminase-like domain-containing protein n=1 Tax=uncultured Cytophagales bacterium TaxID=158755 RepID=A0A6J4IR72_9SPHI|nr:MAG: hypothetical protein AVDCRST_MAG56-2247 [uncultured Cytophagales bacterium]
MHFLRLSLLLAVTALVTPGFCQAPASLPANLASLDGHALRTPAADAKSLERLTAYLTKPYGSEPEKVRSMYAWIVNNIRYDHRLAAHPKRKKVSPKTILKTRRAVCAGYADLFVAMCRLAGIESEVVTGYSRHYNFNQKQPFTRADHAWNAVQLDGQWYLLDATWESKRYGETGSRIESDYFLTDPGVFVTDHLPEDPAWQLLPCPISLRDFTRDVPAIRGTLSRRDTCFSYPDSIAALRRMLPPERELKTARTAHQFNPANHVSIGLALNNYGTYVAKPGAGSPKTGVGFKINKQQEALGYYAEALRHLRKTDRKDFVHTCRKNSRAARATIKRLKKYRRKAPNA